MTEPISVVFFDLGETLVAGREWIPGARETLASLRERGLRMGIISNTDTLSRAQLLPLLPEGFRFEDFDGELILLSSEVRVKKPAPAIFREAVERAKVPPAHCLFVTETALDTLAAQSVGLRAHRVLRVSGDNTSDIGGLPDVLTWLANLPA